jgi:hypothetical protein
LASRSYAGGSSTGLTPINDLGPGLYAGFSGGLYPNGQNTPPPAHQTAAMAMAEQIMPRAAGGDADASGWIGLLSIGMSNTCHEFSVFERQEDQNPGRNARVVLINGAVGGWSASLIADPASNYWQIVDQRLAALNLSAQQVQVVWLKEANSLPVPSFPTHALELKDDLRTIVQIIRDRFPNVRLCYLGSRIYGGYGTWEPEGYETGFAVKWLIEDQISGLDPGLNYGGQPGAIEAPLLLWGPYLWADGVVPRSDGLVWLQSDLEGDNTHPSPSGEQKVADLLSQFLAGEPTAQPWWAAQGGVTLVTIDAQADAYVSNAAPNGSFGTSHDLRHQGGASPIRSYVRFDAGALGSSVLWAKVGLRTVSESGAGGGVLSLVGNTTWSETAITWTNAPPLDGGVLATVPQATRDGTIAAEVSEALNADADGILTMALSNTDGGLRIYHSREGGQAPRLTMVVVDAPAIPAASTRTMVVLAAFLLLAAAVILGKRRPQPSRARP